MYKNYKISISGVALSLELHRFKVASPPETKLLRIRLQRANVSAPPAGWLLAPSAIGGVAVQTEKTVWRILSIEGTRVWKLVISRCTRTQSSSKVEGYRNVRTLRGRFHFSAWREIKIPPLSSSIRLPRASPLSVSQASVFFPDTDRYRSAIK